MSEIVRRPALSHAPLGTAGARLRLRALPEGCVLHILAPPDTPDLAERLAAIGDRAPQAVRPLAPGQWFVVGDAVLSPTDIAAKIGAIEDVAAVSDQSHGRVRIALSGPDAETVLSLGTGVDVCEIAFPVGRCAPTLFEHIGVHLTRTGQDAFELVVLRSFAESLWEALAMLGRERYGENAGS